MHLIETHAAPSPRRVNIFLAEKGIVVRREEINMMTDDLKQGEFAALNPWHRVPVLVLDDGRTISETVAICRYFEEITPEPPLFGVGPIGKAEVEMWNRRVEFGLWSAVFAVFRHLHPKMAHLEVPQVAVWGEANKDKVTFELRRLDDALRESRFIAGSDYSIADITALVAIDFMKPARLAKPEAFGNVMRWHNEVSTRASAMA
jgi:glutathione S-transferase